MSGKLAIIMVLVLCLLLSACSSGVVLSAVEPTENEQTGEKTGSERKAEESLLAAAAAGEETSALTWVLEKKELELDQWNETDALLLEKLASNLDHLSAVLSEDMEKELVFSPFSFYMALLALRPGLTESAREEWDRVINPAGLTDEEWERVLMRLQSSASYPDGEGEPQMVWENHTLAIASDQLTYHPEYLNGLATTGIEAAQADLTREESYREINRLVEKQTGGLIEAFFEEEEIRDLLSRDLLRSILLNTLYFKSDWDHKFIPENTEEKTFYGRTGERNVPMMYLRDEDSLYLETEDYVATRKSFLMGGSMLIVMPKQEVSPAEHMAFLREAKTSDAWQEAWVSLGLPKWEQENKVDLREAVEKLGINPLLEQEANLQFFTVPEALTLTTALQQVRVKVEEKGVEAAAVTAFKLDAAAMSTDKKEVEMIVDHPFAYAIETRQGLSLIQGVVLDLP